MSDFVTQEYVDYQFDMNEISCNKLWDKIRELEQRLDDLKSDLWRAEDRISNLENQVNNLERGY
jgi:chromosome segregation ATPase